MLSELEMNLSQRVSDLETENRMMKDILNHGGYEPNEAQCPATNPRKPIVIDKDQEKILQLRNSIASGKSMLSEIHRNPTAYADAHNTNQLAYFQLQLECLTASKKS